MDNQFQQCIEVLEKRIAAVEAQIQELLEEKKINPGFNSSKIRFAQPIYIDEISD